MTNPTKDETPHKLVAAYFVNVVQSMASAQHVAVGTSCKSIVPAVVQSDGDWAAIDKGQRPDGIGITRELTVGTQRKVVRTFVPWVNVSDLAYGA